MLHGQEEGRRGGVLITAAMGTLPVYHYQRALDEFQREGEPRPLLKKMSELISLLDLTTTLNSSLSQGEILDAALLIVMGELQVRRACLLVRGEGDRYHVRAARGLPEGWSSAVTLAGLDDTTDLVPASRCSGLLADHGLVTVCPIVRFAAAGGRRTIAAVAVGPRAEGADHGPEEATFLRSVAACAAAPLENALIADELRRVNQRLSVRIFQLNGLFDTSRELTAVFDEGHVLALVTSAMMGHLMVSRGALFRRAADGSLVLAHGRGVRRDASPVPAAAAGAVDGLSGPAPASALPAGELRARLEADRLALVAPIAVAGRAELVIAVGERPSGAPLSEEDGVLLSTLGRQALAALESVRLHRVEVENQRRDREMQIARDIQRSLFPAAFPRVPGLAVAADSRSAYEVGGDHYDVIPIRDGRVAVAVADVAGKGAPAAILMASVHAWLRALAGTASPTDLAGRLNAFLFENTQPNRFVTLFYAEYDPEARRLRYVDAGHVPPFVVRADGQAGRLPVGGPVLGLLEDAVFESGDVVLEPGDLVVAVTDGATEAASPADEEFGDGRVEAVIHDRRREGAAAVLDGLFAAVQSWTGARGCADDLTALVLEAR